MSDNVGSSGFFAILKTPLAREPREDMNEALYSGNFSLRINDEGTLVFSDKRSDGFGLHIGSMRKIDHGAFVQECDNFNLEIDPDSIRPYYCYWYNGSNSDMDDLTLEEYKAHL